MRNLFTFLIACTLSASAWGQYPLVQVSEVGYVADSLLQDCNDTSAYYLDTITVVGYVVMDAGLSEMKSGSINGAGGIRPFLFLVDTANQGEVTPWSGLEVMGVNYQTQDATAGITTLISGDLVEITGVVDLYNGATQFQPLNNNSYTILTSSFPSFTPETVSVGELGDQNQINQLETGEQWEGAFIRIEDVTVTAVNPFGSGTEARFSFTVTDASGNSMQIGDFFVAQRLPSWSTLNPNSPYSNGIFSPPSVGTFYNSISGVIEHDGNGCLGGGQGYILHPFDSAHYDVGEAFPTFTFINTQPTVPATGDSIVVNAEIIDSDDGIDSVQIYWSADTTVAPANYSSASMNLTTNNIYSYTIPPQSQEGIVNYYIMAVDLEGNVSYYPTTSSSQAQNVDRIYVRDEGLSIMDIQTPIPGQGNGSPFVGEEVTVRGFVTSALRQCDLGYLYIQDTSANAYAGIEVTGGPEIADIYRNEYVQVTGTINEEFGVTYLNASSVTGLGKSYEVEPIVLDPSDASELDNYDQYVGMLVSYRNPGGSLYITDADLGFGEYAISTTQNPASDDNQRRILAGRQDDTRARSSLNVQLITDSLYITQDGQLAYTDPVITNTNMTMDAITGVLWYAFGNYKLTPRNNYDIENLSTPLDTASCNVPTNVSIDEVSLKGQNVMVYPNPAQDHFTVESTEGNVSARLIDLTGKVVAEQARENNKLKFRTADLNAGVYILQVSGQNDVQSTYKVVVTH